MQRFRAFRIHEDRKVDPPAIRSGLEWLEPDALPAGEVLIAVAWSGINYKDALAATGAGRILRRYPLTGGVDLSGTVVESSDARFAPGAAVLVTGCGLSEVHDGGYAQYARVPADWVVPLPAGLTLRTAMILGTAGFTAALAIHRMEHNGQIPAKGPILVSGATGGVGSVAIDLLAARGYAVVALTAKPAARAYLEGLGASEVLLAGDLPLTERPLERARWGGAIDNLGGPLLSYLVRSTENGGNVASIGLAAGAVLTTSVMPFILRGVNLLGINSAATPRPTRLAVWQRLATDLAPRHLEKIVTRTVELEALPAAFQVYLDGKNSGRTLVRVSGAGA